MANRYANASPKPGNGVFDKEKSGAANKPVNVLAAIESQSRKWGDHPNANALMNARAAIAELIEAASKVKDTNRDDYVLGRPDVSGLPEAEREVFLRGWDAASEAVFRTGLRAALVAIQGENGGDA